MENNLERVSTVQQTDMGSTRLPLELQQQIYSCLDTRSFHAARNVCKWWRFASLDAVTLSRQLHKLPVLPPASAGKSSPQEMQSLWSEAAHTLLLGTRVQRQQDLPGTTAMAQKLGFTLGPRVIMATKGDRTVTINDRTIALFDTSGGQPKVTMQRLLNDYTETVGSAPWLRVAPTSYRELALSASGILLAVAHERTIQIYDLAARPDSIVVHEYIDSAAGHHICGLEFEQHDRVLRVSLSGKGAVLYLGTPAAEKLSNTTGTREHWSSKAGLSHVFLHSALLAINSQDNTSEHVGRLSGLQLLRPWQEGFLFAAQRHGGNESSHYVLAHIKCSVPGTTHELTAEPGSVAILARLESFLSAWDYTLNSKNESGMGLSENMPSAHEHHTTLALSPDSNMLVVAERNKKTIRPVPLTQLFLYRLPGERRMLGLLEEQLRERSGESATLPGVLGKLETGRAYPRGRSGTTDGLMKYNVARIPLCLSTLRGAVSELKFEQVMDVDTGSARAFALTACTTEAVKGWTVTEL
ncbi:hypothetical protein B0A55_05102 [Friedmanniomyces simplex]|uniref:F-box domain-containing protein n=1 Tax=Friedmanniomyces simplex TaxID=329884 RepID=A0A4U0XD56_9PEZI|nr:hypothetical protein B0A55_05102 [Friedmanniomyces simplex]